MCKQCEVYDITHLLNILNCVLFFYSTILLFIVVVLNEKFNSRLKFFFFFFYFKISSCRREYPFWAPPHPNPCRFGQNLALVCAPKYLGYYIFYTHGLNPCFYCDCSWITSPLVVRFVTNMTKFFDGVLVKHKLKLLLWLFKV